MNWIDTNRQKPADEQTVLGRYNGPNYCGPDPCFESLTYYAEDAPDGPACWKDRTGTSADEPDYWLPLDALPVVPARVKS
jgi:hypothetical protein